MTLHSPGRRDSAISKSCVSENCNLQTLKIMRSGDTMISVLVTCALIACSLISTQAATNPHFPHVYSFRVEFEYRLICANVKINTSQCHYVANDATSVFSFAFGVLNYTEPNRRWAGRTVISGNDTFRECPSPPNTPPSNVSLVYQLTSGLTATNGPVFGTDAYLSFLKMVGISPTFTIDSSSGSSKEEFLDTLHVVPKPGRDAVDTVYNIEIAVRPGLGYVTLLFQSTLDSCADTGGIPIIIRTVGSTPNLNPPVTSTAITSATASPTAAVSSSPGDASCVVPSVFISAVSILSAALA